MFSSSMEKKSVAALLNDEQYTRQRLDRRHFSISNEANKMKLKIVLIFCFIATSIDTCFGLNNESLIGDCRGVLTNGTRPLLTHTVYEKNKYWFFKSQRRVQEEIRLPKVFIFNFTELRKNDIIFRFYSSLTGWVVFIPNRLHSDN